MSDIGKRWTLLVIDNNLEAVNFLREMLEKSAYSIVSTNDGEEGFNILLQDPERFAAIILGQNIQGINGVRLVHKINSSSSMKTIPVIMEASTGTLEEMEICIRAGARYYIPKPIDKAAIPRIIATAIRDQSRYREAEQAIWNYKAINTLVHATFKVQSLHDVQPVASLIANECPNPRLAAVGISEILINAIEHGNLGITYTEKTALHEKEDWLNEIERRLQLPENKK